MKMMPESTIGSNLISRTGLKRRYRLNRSAIKLLGECDEVRPDPHSPNASPAFLYDLKRVEQFVVQQRAARRKGVRRRGLELTREFRIDPLPPAARLTELTKAFLLERYGHCPRFVTDNALCAFILHRHSNGGAILAEIAALVGKSEPYRTVKLILCCEVMLACDLSGDPRVMAGGDGDGQGVLTPAEISAVRNAAIRELQPNEGGS